MQRYLIYKLRHIALSVNANFKLVEELLYGPSHEVSLSSHINAERLELKVIIIIEEEIPGQLGVYGAVEQESGFKA